MKASYKFLPVNRSVREVLSKPASRVQLRRLKEDFASSRALDRFRIDTETWYGDGFGYKRAIGNVMYLDELASAQSRASQSLCSGFKAD